MPMLFVMLAAMSHLAFKTNFHTYSSAKEDPKCMFIFQWKVTICTILKRGKKKIVIWSNIQQAFICTFYLLLAPKLHYFYKYLSIVSGFCTDLPSVASSSLNIQLWHVSCTHPSLSRSERSSNHHLWSWPSWHGEHWWLCTGHAFALEVEAAWKGRNHLASTRKTRRKHGNNAIHLSYWTTNYSKQSTERKAVEKNILTKIS